MADLPYQNREDAARQLAQALLRFRASKPVVLAIARGGVPMGRRIADALHGELDVVLVRKLGAPGNAEYAIGAIDESGALMRGEGAGLCGADDAYVRDEARRQLALIRARRLRYRHPAIALRERTVIVVDDGLATGATMAAALQAARRQSPAHLVCAVPVGAAESVVKVSALADEVVCLATPFPFHAVGQFYEDFAEVDDAQVAALLAARPGGA